jgi:hypothetical protein
MAVFTDLFVVLMEVLRCCYSLYCGFVLEVGDIEVHFPFFKDRGPQKDLPLELFA